MLWCISMQPTRVSSVGYFCELAVPNKMCTSLVFDSNTSNLLITYNCITSIVVNYKSKYELHCYSNTNANTYLTQFLTSFHTLCCNVSCLCSQQSKYKVINRDQWCNVLEFSRLIHPDLNNYDEDGACK